MSLVSWFSREYGSIYGLTSCGVYLKSSSHRLARSGITPQPQANTHV